MPESLSCQAWPRPLGEGALRVRVPGRPGIAEPEAERHQQRGGRAGKASHRARRTALLVDDPHAEHLLARREAHAVPDPEVEERQDQREQPDRLEDAGLASAGRGFLLHARHGQRDARQHEDDAPDHHLVDHEAGEAAPQRAGRAWYQQVAEFARRVGGGAADGIAPPRRAGPSDLARCPDRLAARGVGAHGVAPSASGGAQPGQQLLRRCLVEPLDGDAALRPLRRQPLAQSHDRGAGRAQRRVGGRCRPGRQHPRRSARSGARSSRARPRAPARTRASRRPSIAALQSPGVASGPGGGGVSKARLTSTSIGASSPSSCAKASLTASRSVRSSRSARPSRP